MKTKVRYQKSDVGILLFLLLFLFDFSSHAQTINLTTGQKIDALSVRRDGDMVLAKVQVGSGNGEVGYHLAQIARVDFPEPRGLKTAADWLIQGQAEKALAEINTVIAFYDQFKEVPGSWWSQAALIKVSILTTLRRDSEAEALTDQIQKAVTDPETARAAQLRLAAGFIRKKDFDRAVTICDAAIKQSNDSSVLATAWVTKGDALLAQKQSDSALLSYLHVPIFYQDEQQAMPAALLGSARAYLRLDDKERATKSFQELIASFPKSAQAGAAQTELQKLQKE